MDLRHRLASVTAISLVAVLPSVFSAPAQAGGLGAGETVISATTTPAGVGESSVAVLSDGRFLTVWEGARQVTTGTTQGVKREIFGRLSSAQGTPLGSPVLLASEGGVNDATQDVADPAVTTLPSGQVALVYAADVLPNTDPSGSPADLTNWQIAAQVLDPGALAQGTGTPITAVAPGDASYDQQHPDVAVDHGRIRFVWDGDTPTTGEGQSHVWTTSLTLALGGTPTAVRVSPAAPVGAVYDHTRPRVDAVTTAGPAGDAAVIWESVTDIDLTADDLPVRRVDVARVEGTSVTPGILIGEYDPSQSVEEVTPDIVATATGYRAVWSSNLSGAYRIYSVVLSSSLITMGSANAITAGHDTWPSVVVDPSQPGQVVVSFARRTDTAVRGHYEVLSGRFSEQGALLEPLTQVSTVDGNTSLDNAESMRPATGVRAEGGVVHAWSRVRSDTGPGVATRMSAALVDLSVGLTVSPARATPARVGINPATPVTVEVAYGSAANSSGTVPTSISVSFPGFTIDSAMETGPAVATSDQGVFTTPRLAAGAGGTITLTGTMDTGTEGAVRVATATIVPTGGIVIDDPTTNNTATGSVTLDYPPRLQSMAQLDPNPTNASMRWRVLFDQTVSGVDAADFQVVETGGVTGTISSVTCVTNNCTVTVTPSGTVGTLSVRLLGTATITDPTGNALATGNLPATSSAYSVDLVAPSVTVTALGPDPTNAALIAFRLDFSEPVTAPVAADLTVSGGAVDSIVTTDGGSAPSSSWTVRVAPSADGLVSLTPEAGAAADSAGNPSTAGTTESRTSDRTSPVLTLGAPIGPLRTAYDVTVTASEPVTGLALGDFSVVGGTVESLTGDGPWTAHILPTTEGPVVVTVAADAVQDAAGNSSALRSVSTTYDVTRPSVTVSSAAGNPTGDNPIGFTLTFSEPVTGLTVDELTVTGGTATISGTGATRTVDVTPSADGPVSVAVPADVADDEAGNTNTVGAGVTRTYDTTGPTPQVTADVGSPTKATSFTLTVTWPEDVSDFTEEDIVVTNGTLSGFAGSGQGYTATVTPTADGTVRVEVPAGGVHDPLGNESLAATPLERTADQTRPTVVLTGPTGPDSASSSVVDVTFSEPVSGLALADFVVGNGTVSDLTGSGTDYTVTVEPQGEGDVTVHVPADSASDAATNQNQAGNTLTWIHDVTATAVLDYTGLSDVNAPIGLTLTLSDDATIAPADFTTLNGTVTSVTGGPRVFDVVFAPDADGSASVRLTAGAFTDAAGNVSSQSGLVAVDHDTVRPAVTDLAVPAWPTAPFTVSVEFSEPVTGLTASGITVTNGTVSQVSGSGTEWTFLVTPASDGTVTVSVDDGAALDAAGNDSVAFGPASTTYDTTPPTVSLTSPTSAVVTTSPIPVEVLFTEPVSGVDVADFVTTNGTVTNLAGGGDRWTLDLVPTAEGIVSLQLSAEAANDQSGQPSAASPVLTREFDSTRPTLALTTTVAPVTDASAIPVTATFNKAVLGFDASDLQPSNATVSGFTTVDSRTWTFTLTPTADGVVTVGVPANAAASAGGNLAFGGTLSVTVDRVAPVVSVSAPSSTTVSGPVTFGITLSEAAMVLDEADLAVSGSAGPTTIALVPVSTGAWQAVVSGMTGAGNVTLAVREAAVRDAAGLSSKAADATATWQATSGTLRSISLPRKAGLRAGNHVVLPLEVRGSGDLVFTATSSNQRLLPTSAISVTGSGTRRQLTLAARANSSGRSRVVVTAQVGSTVRRIRLTLVVGGPEDERLVGGRGIDVMLARTGLDAMEGRGGNDHLYAGFGADHLAGGAGSDVLVAGPGQDVLTGGAGADLFVAWPHTELVDVRRSQGDRVERPTQETRRLMFS